MNLGNAYYLNFFLEKFNKPLDSIKIIFLKLLKSTYNYTIGTFEEF